MALNPAPRRRAVNTDATPLVPVHETHARAFIRANKTKNDAAKIERDEKQECHKAMLAANINSFELVEGNQTYDCIIASATEDKVSIEKLYAMVGAGEITLDQFVKCCSATQKAVKDELGTNVLNSVLVTNTKDADLSIKVRK